MLREGERLDAGGCPAVMRLGWAIQSSWTNGVRLKLTRPICGTYGKYFSLGNHQDRLALGSSCSQTVSTPAQRQSPR